MDLEKGINLGATADEKKLRRAASELRHIKLRWTMPENNGRRVLELEHDKADVEVQEPYLQRRRVRWQ